MDPFRLPSAERQSLLLNAIRSLTDFHYHNCAGYQRILDAIGHKPGSENTLEDVPYLPVGLFKHYDLHSLEDTDVFKVLTSSGTSGQRPSRIHLDKQTASAQTRALTHIVNAHIGRKRLPMILIDTPSVLKNRRTFSARSAGILGFSMFGRDRLFVLDDEMQLDVAALTGFLEQHAGKKSCYSDLLSWFGSTCFKNSAPWVSNRI